MSYISFIMYLKNKTNEVRLLFNVFLLKKNFRLLLCKYISVKW